MIEILQLVAANLQTFTLCFICFSSRRGATFTPCVTSVLFEVIAQVDLPRTFYGVFACKGLAVESLKIYY